MREQSGEAPDAQPKPPPPPPPIKCAGAREGGEGRGGAGGLARPNPSRSEPAGVCSLSLAPSKPRRAQRKWREERGRKTPRKDEPPFLVAQYGGGREADEEEDD